MRYAGTRLHQAACRVPGFVRAARTPLAAWKRASFGQLCWLFRVFGRVEDARRIHRRFQGGAFCCAWCAFNGLDADEIRRAVPRSARDRIIRRALAKVKE